MSCIVKRLTSITSKTLNSHYWVPQVTQVRNARFHYWKEKRENGPLVRNCGYSDPLENIRGLLPRQSEEPIKQLPIYRPKNFWSPKRALFGQNDYIDILGDDSLHPTRILYNVPSWLRGVRGNEFQVLLRKERIWSKGIFPIARPTRWKQITFRISKLYDYLDRKTKTGLNNKW